MVVNRIYVLACEINLDSNYYLNMKVSFYMGINIRQKGQGGEREVQRALEPIVRSLMAKYGYPLADKAVVQRNQNQSAVGGSDLSNTFGLSIEVKRQETLSVNTWWIQCERQARDTGEVPVLLYRQNGKRWRCRTYMQVELPKGNSVATAMTVIAEMEWPQFLLWFENWVDHKLRK